MKKHNKMVLDKIIDGLDWDIYGKVYRPWSTKLDQGRDTARV